MGLLEKRDEMTVVDVYMMVRKRKAVFLTVVALTMLIGAGIATLAPPAYDSKAIISIGTIGSEEGGLDHIEDPYVLKESLEQQGLRVTFTSRNSAGLLSITASADSPVEARERVAGTVQKILAQHSNKYDNYRKAVDELLTKTKEEIGHLESRLRSFEQLLSKMKEDDENSDAISLLIEKEKMSERLLHYYEQVSLLDRDRLYMTPSKIIAQASMPLDSNFRLALYVVVNLLLSIIFGFVVVYLQETLYRMTIGSKR